MIFRRQTLARQQSEVARRNCNRVSGLSPLIGDRNAGDQVCRQMGRTSRRLVIADDGAPLCEGGLCIFAGVEVTEGAARAAVGALCGRQRIGMA